LLCFSASPDLLLVSPGKSTAEMPFWRLLYAEGESVHRAVVHIRRKENTMNQMVILAIEELRELNVAALRTKYRQVLGEESKSFNKQFLLRRIAWRLQANAEGDVSERARHRAAAIADDADLRTRAPKGFLDPSVSLPVTVDRSRSARDWRLPPPGTLLTRRLDNRQIVVKVLEQGFEYDSRRYRSLSAIAREITGTRWNGLLFFGLAERRDA
jgi:hypothetical protein